MYNIGDVIQYVGNGYNKYKIRIINCYDNKYTVECLDNIICEWGSSFINDKFVKGFIWTLPFDETGTFIKVKQYKNHLPTWF